MTASSVKGLSQICATTKKRNFLETFGQPEINQENSKQFKNKDEFLNLSSLSESFLRLYLYLMHNYYASNYANY